MKPDAEIDGAEVLYWAWSGSSPFGVMSVSDGSEIEIYGFAIATYDHTQFYRFSCNKHWATENDTVHPDIESAKSSIPLNYQNISVKWHKYACI